MLTGVSRRVILSAAQSERIGTFARRHGHMLGARRFVAGETIDECIAAIREMNAQGLKANTALLGEGVKSAGEARAVADEYAVVLDRIASAGVRCNVALKLSHLGVMVSEQLAFDNLERLLIKAQSLGNFIRIDMEDSPLVDVTLRIYRGLRDKGHDNVGVVLQAYLFRSEADLDSLLPRSPNIRIVKGAYLESPSIAYPEKTDVDANYIKMVKRAMEGGAYTCVATHDDRIIEEIIAFAHQRDIKPEGRFEFQMLYGVRTQYQLQLVRRGYPVLVATPFGQQWFPFFMRRMAERPANLGFVLKNLVRR